MGNLHALSPGTTPFVAMALMEMAVSIVWKQQQSKVMGELNAKFKSRLMIFMFVSGTFKRYFR